jgi:hypothetical protein
MYHNKPSSRDTAYDAGSLIAPIVSAYVIHFTVGLSSWLLVNSLFGALSILVDSTPEANNIAAYLSLVLQLGNLVAFVIAAIRTRIHVAYSLLIPSIIVVAIGCSLGLAFGWQDTVEILGDQYSVVLLCMTFVAGAVGASSVVVYLPWASHNPVLTSAVATGMGMLCGDHRATCTS